jgi:CBS domain-containing protein
MQCETIMKRKVEYVSPQDTAQRAACLMRDENVGFLPICDPSMKVLGAVTDRDIAVRLVAPGKTAGTPVIDIMTHEVVSCSPKDDLRKAERLMAEHRKSRIMCIDESGRLAGVISLSDIAQHESALRASDTLRDVTAREARA